MCGRFTSSQRRAAMGERFEVAVPKAYQHRFNLAPQQRALIVRERDDEREAVMAKWGLLPFWAKDSKIAFKMINARAETLTEKPAYRSLIGKHRCLIPADGFYEWTVGSDGKKQPIHLHRPDYELFAFAGLWTSRTDDHHGQPNELVAPVHDRMPVILPTDAERVWLDPTISKEHALSLLEPYPADLMLALPASTRVNSVRNDDSGLLLPNESLAA
jgi:putative SOS response-associated peptidase YedK